jgi:hypothetical protein
MTGFLEESEAGGSPLLQNSTPFWQVSKEEAPFIGVFSSQPACRLPHPPPKVQGLRKELRGHFGYWAPKSWGGLTTVIVVGMHLRGVKTTRELHIG